MDSNNLYEVLMNSNISNEALITAICNYFDSSVLKDFAVYLKDEGLIELEEEEEEEEEEEG